MIFLLAKIVASFLVVSFIHEVSHFLFAMLFKRKGIKFHVSWTSFFITYENNSNDFQNLIIAISAPLVTTSIGFFLVLKIPELTGLGILFLTNIINFFPITNDGEIILMSLVNITRREK
ncbi:metalloprotease family protein [Enterococcus casseliflavus]|uniref:metalloprotease family protein n=1 Tax=Enterococcus casseliflavus TaxID=37734 RepID=UPI0034D302A8